MALSMVARPPAIDVLYPEAAPFDFHRKRDTTARYSPHQIDGHARRELIHCVPFSTPTSSKI